MKQLLHWHEPDDPARHRRDETVCRSCTSGVVNGEVHVAVRSLDDVANAAVLIEDHFLPRHPAARDFETAKCLPGETADKQARILPARDNDRLSKTRCPPVRSVGM